MSHIIRRFTRPLAGVVTFAATAVLLAGIPAALVAGTGSPWSAHLAEPDDLRRRLESGDVRGPLIVVLAVLVWLAWARLVLAFVVIAAARVRQVEVPSMAVLGSAQGVAAGLFTGLALLVPASGRTVAAPAAGPQVAHGAAVPTGVVPAQADDVWTVRRGDTLWAIARARLGDGREWRRIWALNGGRNFGDRVFDDPNLILPGWRLWLPAEQADGAHAEPPRQSNSTPAPQPATAAESIPDSQPIPEARPTSVGDSMPDAPPIADAAGESMPLPVDHEPIVADVAPPRPIPEEPSDPDPDLGDVDSRPLIVPDVLFPGGVMLPSSTAGEGDDVAPDSTVVSGAAGHESGRSWPLGVAAVALIGGGAAAAAGRRRRTTRSRRVGIAPAPVMRLDHIRYALDPAARTERVERAWAVVVGFVHAERRDARPVAAVISATGEIEVHFDGDAGEPPDEWVDASTHRWHLPAQVATRALEPPLGALGAPPTLLALVGWKMPRSDRTDVYVDLRATRGLAVDAPDPLRVEFLREFASTLATSPSAAEVELIVASDDGIELHRRRPDDATWGPTVVVLMNPSAALPSDFEVAHDALVVGPSTDESVHVLRQGSAGWMLEPVGIELVPLGLEREDVDAVRFLLEAAHVEAEHEPSPVGDQTAFLVRLLGPAEVSTGTGETVAFERAKSLELLCWLTLHRAGATRTAARAALWDGRIRDATFSNVVSEARRALARHVSPRADDDWIRRVNGDHLRLHPAIGCDADELERAVTNSRATDDDEARRLLRSALAFVRGVPLAGAGFVWADAEGISARLTMLVIGAATDLGERELLQGDIDGVLWASGVGLGVVPGHEDLIALRMRAYAQAGDPAGVRSEWDAYERTLAADPWAFESSPRLEQLRRELLRPALSNRP